MIVQSLLAGFGRMSLERRALTLWWGLGCVGFLLGITAHPSLSATPGFATQLVDVIRLGLCIALTVTLVLGPGLAVRVHRPNLQLAFVALPGMAFLALTGIVAWLLGIAGWVHPRVVSAVMLAPMLGLTAAVIGRSDDRRLLSNDEWHALIVVGGALGVAVGRSLWSLSPPGELYAGQIYRTLEVSDRPDSRISYHVVELVTYGNSPWGTAASSYFAPYTFSSRGPLPGLASAPIVLTSGGTPPEQIGSPPWTPFDAQGFMAYRVAMMTFACTSFLSVWTVARKLAGVRAARFAVLLACTTPFLVHEIWFTWPKLLAASMVLLGASCLLDRRPLLAGIFVGIGYLVHPLALLSLPALLLIALWPVQGGKLSRPKILPAVLLVVGAVAFLAIWREINGSHFTQGGFFNYLTQSSNWDTLKGIPGSIGAWIEDRLTSLSNTIVPFRLFFLGSGNQEVNAVQPACFPFCIGGSPGIIHWFYQYWDTVPFGFGILFFPLLLTAAWRALRRWTWATVATVLIPFFIFVVYWGSANTGLMREGLHAWVLTVIIVLAVVEASRGFGWLSKRWTTLVLCSRVIEILLVAMLPTLVTTHRLLAAQFWFSDLVAAVAMVGFSGFLIAMLWREHAQLAIRVPDHRPAKVPA